MKSFSASATLPPSERTKEGGRAPGSKSKNAWWYDDLGKPTRLSAAFSCFAILSSSYSPLRPATVFKQAAANGWAVVGQTNHIKRLPRSNSSDRYENTAGCAACHSRPHGNK